MTIFKIEISYKVTESSQIRFKRLSRFGEQSVGSATA